MTTDTETRNPWTGWYFTTPEALEKALEEYASFQGVPLVQQYGDFIGGDADAAMNAHEAVMKANEAIDRAMARIWHVHKLSHKLIHVYYRKGGSYEQDGWRQAMDATGLTYHCTTKREHERHKHVFEALLSEAVGALWWSHNAYVRRAG